MNTKNGFMIDLKASQPILEPPRKLVRKETWSSSKNLQFLAASLTARLLTNLANSAQSETLPAHEHLEFWREIIVTIPPASARGAVGVCTFDKRA